MQRKILWLWRSLPVIVRAVTSGLLLAAAGTIPWAILVSANAKHLKGVPWAVAPAALYLWLWWRFASGISRPHSTAQARRNLCRANSLSADVWGMAILAGIPGIAAVVLLQSVMVRLVTLPQEQAVAVTIVMSQPLRFVIGNTHSWLSFATWLTHWVR